MANIALAADLIARDKASAVMDRVGGKTDKTGKRFSKLGATAKAAIAGAVGGSVTYAASRVFDMASSMELMDNKAKTVFGNQIGLVDRWAKKNANAMGLTSREATGLAANFADLLVPMGFTRREAAKMSTDVVGLSGALSRWSGGKRTAAEVSEILSKAMLGERDGLKELGISISEADVQARLAAEGKSKLTGAALEQAKAEATSALIFEKSKDAQAAYANGADTLAAKKAKASAKLREFRDNGIAKLIPLLSKAADFIDRNSAVLKPLAVVVGSVTLAVVAVTAATAAYNAVLALNPIGLVVIAIAALAAGLIYAYKKSETFRGIVDGAFKVISTSASFMWNDVLRPVFRLWLNAWFTVVGALVNGAASAFGWVPGIGDKLKAAAKKFNQFRDDVNRSLDGIKDRNIKVDVRASTLTAADLTTGRRYAGGTSSAARGLALVGEEGPELVEMRGGERVHTAAATRRLISSGSALGGGAPVVVQVSVQGSVIRERDLARSIREEIAQLMRRRGADPAALGLA